MECYSIIKRNKVLTDASTWKHLKNIMLSGKRQTQKADAKRQTQNMNLLT